MLRYCPIFLAGILSASQLSRSGPVNWVGIILINHNTINHPGDTLPRKKSTNISGTQVMIFIKENIRTIRFKATLESKIDGILINIMEKIRLVKVTRNATSWAEAPEATKDGA